LKTITKVQQVPTVLLDMVLDITLKKHSKTPNSSIKTHRLHTRPVVMYKMISTEEWQKKEELRIAKINSVKAFYEKPKPTKEERSKASNAYSAVIMPSGLSRRQEYYQKNKERIKLKQQQKNKKKK